jgi:hypothetical protein
MTQTRIHCTGTGAGVSFALPAGVKHNSVKARELLADSYKFAAAEIEVFARRKKKDWSHEQCRHWLVREATAVVVGASLPKFVEKLAHLQFNSTATTTTNTRIESKRYGNT